MKKITIARGDGIGPEIMDATLFILDKMEVPLEYDEIQIGEKVYESGLSSGISKESWATLKENKVFLKAPITTPRGRGYKSLNVTVRKTLGLFANVRSCPTFDPFISTTHPNMDVVIVRENEEDTYGGIEHRQTQEVTQCLKLITKPGCEKICRYAFEYARVNGRKKVTCLVKDNIMKITDGLFKEIFEEIAEEYDDIESDTMIIDIGSAKLAKHPEMFDVVVTPNLYGDIVSDIAAEISGSVGIGGSANIGEDFAMFEAIHGSAPDIAGKGIANPSGLIHATIMMLDHVGLPQYAETLHNAWLKTIEDGVLTADLTDTDYVTTMDFAEELVKRLGKKPVTLPIAEHFATDKSTSKISTLSKVKEEKKLIGVDIFLDWDKAGRDPNILGDKLNELNSSGLLKLVMISNRGTKVYPDGFSDTFCTDHWRCRFKYNACHQIHIINLMTALMNQGFDIIKTENLYEFDGKAGYSLGQGE